MNNSQPRLFGDDITEENLFLFGFCLKGGGDLSKIELFKTISMFFVRTIFMKRWGDPSPNFMRNFSTQVWTFSRGKGGGGNKVFAL